MKKFDSVGGSASTIFDLSDLSPFHWRLFKLWWLTSPLSRVGISEASDPSFIGFCF